MYRIDHVTKRQLGSAPVTGRSFISCRSTPRRSSSGSSATGGRPCSRPGSYLPGTRVRLSPEPATDHVDGSGRLLRYVVRSRRHQRERGPRRHRGSGTVVLPGASGLIASQLELFAKSAMEKKLGLAALASRRATTRTTPSTSTNRSTVVKIDRPTSPLRQLPPSSSPRRERAGQPGAATRTAQVISDLAEVR